MARTPRLVRFQTEPAATLAVRLPALAEALLGRADDEGVSLALLVPSGQQLVLVVDRQLVDEFPHLIPLAAPPAAWSIEQMVALVGRGEGEFTLTVAGERFALIRLSRLRSLARVRIVAAA